MKSLVAVMFGFGLIGCSTLPVCPEVTLRLCPAMAQPAQWPVQK